jgi:hypothetical protein
MPAVSDRPRPRSVRKEFFDEVCPKSERLILSSKAVSSKYENGQWVSAKESIERWASLLKSVSFRCIEITEGRSIFDWTLVCSRFTSATVLMIDNQDDGHYAESHRDMARVQTVPDVNHVGMVSACSSSV